MNYPLERACSLVPLSAACLTTQCDKRSYAQKLWRSARTVSLRRCLDLDLPWAGVVMLHPGMAPGLIRGGIPPHLLRVARNPVDPFTTERIRAEDNHGVAFVGRVEAEKGIEDLAEAAAQAAVPLTVIGDGPLREPLALRFPLATFTGWLDRNQIAHHVSRVRVLAMPSRYPEPFGLVAAEASKSGLPVIVSSDALLGPEIAEGRVGWSLRTSDVGALANLLTAIHHLPSDEVRTMSERAYNGTTMLSSSPYEWQSALLALLSSNKAFAPHHTKGVEKQDLSMTREAS